jgi:hypothetical protein
MGAIAQLSEASVDVEPGRSVTLSVTIRNTGTVVDRFVLEAIGTPEPWTTFEPRVVSLFPQASETVKITIAPPRDPSAPAGPCTLGVRIRSSEDPDGSVVEEATVNVGAFSNIALELVPNIATGRMSARTRLAIDNRSNCPYRAELSGEDAKESLRFSFRPVIVEIPPGQAVFSKVGVRPTRRFWRGPARTHSFTITARSAPVETTDGTSAPKPDEPSAPSDKGDGSTGAVAVMERTTTTDPHPEVITTDGSMVQESMLPRWLIPLLLLLALLVLLWFLLFKPTIHNEATNAAKAAVAPLSSQVQGANKAAQNAQTTANKALQTPPPTTTTTTVVTVGSTTTTTLGSPATTATGSRLSLTVAQNATGSTILPNIPANKSFALTDVVFENAAGDSGTVSILRGTTPVLVESLANFRSLDYHFVSPIIFAPGNAVTLQATCSGNNPGSCTPAAYVGGYVG